MKLHLLGTGAAISAPHRTTTMLAFSTGTDTLVVDCGGDAVQRLLAADIALDSISGLIITHEHADHVSGFPLFMEKIWLAGRRRPLPVYGIAPALDQARRCFETFDTSGWEDMPPINWQPFAHEEEASVLGNDVWRVTASPAQHAKPNVGLRVEHAPEGRAVAYSCDTQPTPAFARLARQAHIVVHEANGAMSGHSSPEQAARVAADADAERLLLVHLPPGIRDEDLADARRIFSRLELGEELGVYPV